ncbi:hypothetical protein CJ199_14675, partial [Brevibacterium paucivorans]
MRKNSGGSLRPRACAPARSAGTANTRQRFCGTPEPQWRQALRFLRVPDAPARGGLAIAFELQRRISWFEQRAGAGTSVSAEDAWDPNVQLVIRPMRRGQRDAWIKGG